MGYYKLKGVKFQNGFTLVELLIVFALITVIGITSVPFYSNFFTQNAAGNTYDQLINHIRKAQTNAMIGKQNSQWGVHNQAGSIILFQGSSFASRNIAFDQKLTLNPNISVSGFTDIIFAKMTGTPSAAATITITGNNTIKTITVASQGIANPANTPATTPTPTPLPGKVGHWKLDEGSGNQAFDSSASGNTGVLHNGPAWTTGKYGQALIFDGVDDEIDLGSPSTFHINGDLTIAAWVKTTNTTKNEMTIITQTTGVINRNYQLHLGLNADLTFQHGNGTSSIRYATAGISLADNQWHHVAFTADYPNGKYYIDGTNVKNITMTFDIVNTITQYHYRTGGSNPAFPGTMLVGPLDDLRIYNRALSPSEIITIYNGAP